MSKSFNLELTSEEMNVVRNGLNYLLLLNKKYPTTASLSPTSRKWYIEVATKFDEIYENNED